MTEKGNLSFLFNPKSVAVIGATNRPGAWGNLIFRGLVSYNYPGKLYPINNNDKNVLGISAYPSLDEVPGEVEVVFIAIPAEKLMDVMNDCIKKGVKGIVIITSGFAEAEGNEGKKQQEKIALFGKKYGIRILGPNVSGIYNLHSNYLASPAQPNQLIRSKITFITQGGYAVENLITRAYSKGIGLGKFVHTGNEADLQCTDFLEYVEKDPETDVILMYVECLNEPGRFLNIAREITKKKPIIIYKGGRTRDGARAAASHTGAMAGSSEIYNGLFEQAGCIQAPSFESILELGYALRYYPALKGTRIGIITWGGSWGVILTDLISMKGLKVQELSTSLQGKLRKIGLPYRASTKNPVDIGAAGITLGLNAWIEITEAVISDEEIDAVVVHGFGLFGRESNGRDLAEEFREVQEAEEKFLRKGVELMRRYEKPFVIGCLMSHLESLTIRNMNQDGIPSYTHIEEMADLLSVLLRYNRKIR
ncbi:MAG: CoA-binding protein [Thermodesulfobacteriota bacterium]|nr:CoA-binding protein [Thermodesulfobacteriota bacterium]